jgi:outer membrane protein
MKAKITTPKPEEMGPKGPRRVGFILAVLMAGIFFFMTRAGAEDLAFFYKASLDFDPRLAGARYEHQASREILKQAWSRLLPTLSLDGSYINTRDDIKSSDNTVFASGATTYPTKTYTVALVQPVFNYASLIGVGKAKEEIKLYDARLERAQQDLILRVGTTYLEALAARDSHAFSKAEETAVGRNFDLARERHAMGLTPIQDMLDSKARYAYVRANTLQAESALQDASFALHELSGITPKTLSGLKTDLVLTPPDPDRVEAWIQIALERSTVLAERKSEVEAAKKEVRRIKAGHYPVVNVEGTDNWRDTDGSLFGGGSEVNTQELTVRMNLPLYQGGIVSSQSRQAYQILQSTSEQLRRETLAVERETRVAFLGVKTALSRAEALARAVEAQQLTLEAKQEGYKSGLNTMMSVLDAERDLYFTRRDYAQARYDYILNIFRLKNAVGSLEQRDVVMVNDWLSENRER